jgi:hypothetical protein
MNARQPLAALVLTLSAAASLAQAGPIRGNVYQNDRANAHSTVTYNEVFVGGSAAFVRVVGDGDTDLDLFVYDENGNLIVSDTDYSDQPYVTFTPAWTGPFRIVVQNRGNVYNDYTIWAW